MINILIVDDHPIVRRGVRQILEDYPLEFSIEEEGEGAAVLNKVMKGNYQMVLLDISIPGRNGLEILKELKKHKPELSVLILSMHPEEQYAVRALKLGAAGYLTKSSVSEELVSAVRRAAAGKKYITSTIAEKLALALHDAGAKTPHQVLSDRELEVMCLIAHGKKVTEIAEELKLSDKTISTYRTRILEKMNFKNTADIIRYALRAGLIE